MRVLSADACALKLVMTLDKWVNAGFENEVLRPYVESREDLTDNERIGTALCSSVLLVHRLRTRMRMRIALHVVCWSARSIGV